MTDLELIELVQTKSPAELTDAEVTELRERLPASPALQQAVADHLELERYLADTLGRVAISPEQVLARATHVAGAARNGRAMRWAALALTLGIAVAGGLAWYFSVGAVESKPADVSIAIAKAVAPSPVGPPKPETPPTSPPRPEPTPPPKTVPPETPPASVEPPRNAAAEPYALVDPSEPGLNEAQIEAWFAPVDGAPHALRKIPGNPGAREAPSVAMTGTWRLRPAWKADSALRCLFRSFNTIKFHCWNGAEGVTLEVWRGGARFPTLPDMSLVAYRTTRKGKRPFPDSLVLAAADEGEFWRTRTQFMPSGYPREAATPLDLRHEDGLLTVSFGDVRIRSVPLAAVPSEVYFEGEATFQSLGLAPRIALPPPSAPLPVALDVERPADLPWMGNQNCLEKQPDGSMKLSAAKEDGRYSVATLLPRQGVCVVDLQLEGVMPGTGVFLGDEKGEVLLAASFLREEATNRTLLMETEPGDGAVSVRFMPATRWPAAFVDDKVWLRLFTTGSEFKVWVSRDGTHWARAFESPFWRPTKTWSSVGTYCRSAKEGGRSIRLRRCIVRDLRTLNSLAPAELVRNAPLVPHSLYTPLGEWLAMAHATRPPNVDPAVWSRACAIRALAGGVGPQQTAAMLEALLDHGLAQPSPLETKLRLLDEATLLVPKQPLFAPRFVQYYERLGEALQRQGEPRPWSRLRQALYHHASWSMHVFDVFPEALAVTEMLDLAAAGNWEEAEQVARAGRIHRAGPSIFDWAEVMATGRLPNLKAVPRRRLAMPSEWKPPLVLEVDKDGTADLGEVEAALTANALREAGRMLTRLKGRSDRGLLPDSSDSLRLRSWTVALDDLFETHPDLRTLVRTEFALEGRLQLRRALDEKDEVGLETLGLRYYGTHEAAAALLWLGDRSLGDGDPALAVGRYRQALRLADGPIRGRIEDRLRLTAALLGQPAPAPTEDVVFGEVRLSPAALQALRQKRREAGVDSRWTPGLPSQQAPAAGVFEPAVRGRFEGEVGERPDLVPNLAPRYRPFELDWPARQVGLALDGNLLYVGNRFQVDCWEMPAGKLRWRVPLSRNRLRHDVPGTAYAFPLTPMRPVIAGPHLFVRCLLREPAGPRYGTPPGVATLTCLDKATGKLLWSTTNHRIGHVNYVADPVVIQDQVFAVGQKQSTDGEWTLVLVIHNRSDGTVLTEKTLAAVRSSQDDQRGCQLTALEDSCIASVGGGVLCFDLAGNVRWARRSLWVPPLADPRWILQSQEPPLVVGDRCYVVQPGVFNVMCLAPDSGRMRWQKALSGLRRLAGLIDGRLVVETDGGFVALDAATGKEQWRQDAHRVQSTLCGGPGGLLYAAIEALPANKDLHRPVLVWVDLSTGRETARLPLDGLSGAQPRFGPLFVGADRLWAWSGKDADLKRDLVELVSKGTKLAASTPPTEWDAWTRSVPVSLRETAARVLPGWTVFGARPYARTDVPTEHQGKRDVLCAPPGFVLGHHLDVPAVDKPRLVLRIAHEPKGRCAIAVDVDGKRLAMREFASGGQWNEWEVDLSAYKGKRAWVMLHHLPRDKETECSFWDRIEVRR